MSLLDVQNFLARIYTDENLRREFLREPQQIGLQNNLSEKEIAELTEVFPEELNSFADSLLHKRLREIEKLLPLTRRSLAENFEMRFREFAIQFTPETVKKHLEDAVRFADFLQVKESNWKKDTAKFERAKLEFYGYGKSCVFRIFDYDVKEIVRQGASPQKEFEKKKTFAIWLRIGGKTHHYIR